MTQPLFPTVPTPAQLAPDRGRQTPPPGATVRRDWEFDFLADDLTTTPDGRSVEIRRPEHVVAQHTVINLLIDQASFRIYPRRYGMDYEGAMRLRFRSQVRATVEQMVRRQLRAIRGVFDVIEPRWAPYTRTGARKSIPLLPPSTEVPPTYERMERHSYDELEGVSYAVLEGTYRFQAEGALVTQEFGDTRDHEWLRFVVVMQPGLPRRTLQTRIPLP